ncbi:MAG: hypothetical protein ABI333_12865 [bacterium]
MKQRAIQWLVLLSPLLCSPASPGCRRAEKQRGVDPTLQSAPRTDAPGRAAPGRSGAAPADAPPTLPAMAPDKDAPKKNAPEKNAPEKNVSKKNAPKVLEPDPPGPVTVVQAGVAPRLKLRYRLKEGETLVWHSFIRQVTEVRKEKQCPAPGAKLPPHKAVRTIPMSYRVDIISKVDSADDTTYDLSSRFANVTMSLPPALTSREQLLKTVIGNISYTTRMTHQGRIQRFQLGKLTTAGLRELQKRLRAPLGHLQPVLPDEAVGVGAQWVHLRTLPLLQPGGRIDATYETRYKLTALPTAAGKQVVSLAASTRMTLTGNLMGHPFQGRGTGESRLLLDARRGVLRSARGSSHICSAVLERSSTNRTSFEQTLKDAAAPAPATAPAPSPKRAAPATPRAATPAMKTP